MLTIVLAATLHFAGDSTLDDHGGKPHPPYESWGTATEANMKDGCRVRNLARSGASTRSFIDCGRWRELLDGVEPGDFVAIQFGHNDQKQATEEQRSILFAAPRGLFMDNLRKFAREVRARGATPLFCTPIVRATFDETGRRIVDTTWRDEASGTCLGSYAEATKAAGRELGVDVVDMYGLTKTLCESVGRDEAYRFFVISTGMIKGKDGEPCKDVTHPIKAGADAFARLFVRDVCARRLPVASLFRGPDFPIDEFGARPGGDKCTHAFKAAFAAAEAAGGGRVVVPPGRWISGAIHLRSNCELHLCDGAEIVFTQDPDDYLPAVHTSWEGMECWNYSPLVYAYCCTNIAITGSGTLRGFDGDFNDTLWKKWVPAKSGAEASRRQLYDWGATDYPVEKRRICDRPNANTRPHLLQINRCTGVRLDGFKIRNSPFWTVHLYHSEDIVARGLDVYAHGNNNDGIDIEMSRKVLVEKCRFDQGDDGVVIKSGRNRDAWRLGRPTEDVVVRDCDIVNAHTVLGIGSEISGGVRNILLENCRAGDVFRVFYVKTNRRRGGFVDNIAVRDVTVKSVSAAVLAVETDILYEWAKFPDYELRNTKISNLLMDNVKVGRAKRTVWLKGDPAEPVKGVRVSWLDVESVDEPGTTVENVDGFVEVAGHAANYDVSRIPPYVLEDVLAFADGGKVASAADWPRRRREILDIFAREMYGAEPPPPEVLNTDLLEEKTAAAGYATRRRYRMTFTRDRSGPAVEWTVWTPRFAKGPSPVILGLNYRGTQELDADPSIPLMSAWSRDGAKVRGHRVLESSRASRLDQGSDSIFPLQTILARGYAVMTACYCEVSPDPLFQESDPMFLQHTFAYSGVFSLWGPRDVSRTDNITAIGAWAWALSRGLDLAERIPEIDARRSVATGCSRLAKAALLAAARDERFAVCVPVQTGGGGCPLAKRDFGENTSTENRFFSHWYCDAYAKYSVEPWKTLGFDQHMLLAAIAPRSLLVCGFDSPWFDTEGEFLAARAASPAWELHGLPGLPAVPWPGDFDTSAIGPRLGYVRRSEGHGISGYDWKWMLDFADANLRGAAAGGRPAK